MREQLQRVIFLENVEMTQGVYCGDETFGDIHYDDEAHDVLFELEERSYWFRHRNDVILNMVNQFANREEVFFDVGGGNGNTGKTLQDNGYSVVLVEPGIKGAKNAVKRGLKNVVCARFDKKIIRPSSVSYVGLFDVLEHIEDDGQFLSEIWTLMKPGGFIFVTVPALQRLWAADDVDAGHYRRYDLQKLTAELQAAGFSVEKITYFFQLLVLPIYFFRTLPFITKGKRLEGAKKAVKEREFILPDFADRILMKMLNRETNRIKRGGKIGWGTSILAVGRKNGG